MPDISLPRPLRYAWDYLKEISGENAYDRYLAVHTATHPGRPAMGRGEFYRAPGREIQQPWQPMSVMTPHRPVGRRGSGWRLATWPITRLHAPLYGVGLQ